ncbi:hypothetical protein QJS10_CPA06g01105 [Acorus calamus]|uniref:Uncharacterized protein n=1 Tax=Acorus calamus TaxID=4465 RepID=A0AAV9EN55_ACOCL|nr:hypothetical protein QJS10_CPA06g01105 [Acorus calamus]
MKGSMPMQKSKLKSIIVSQAVHSNYPALSMPTVVSPATMDVHPLFERSPCVEEALSKGEHPVLELEDTLDEVFFNLFKSPTSSWFRLRWGMWSLLFSDLSRLGMSFEPLL